MNPYEVLGVREDADDEEIKKAYRALVKQYHPDRYKDGPMRATAEQKIREINVAYDEIQALRAAGQTYAESQRTRSTRNTGGSDGYSRNRVYNDVIACIQNGQLEEAIQMLEAVAADERDAAWYYLMGEATKRKGWYDTAAQYFETAVRMEPQNSLYRDALYRLRQQGMFYRERSGQRGYAGGGADPYDLCQAMFCANCCCQALGSGCCCGR